MSEESAKYTVNLAELAEILDTSTETLRKVVNRNPDFPCISRGHHGIPYEIDSRHAIQWWNDHKAQADAAQSARSNEIMQLKMELCGGDISEEEQEILKLSGKQRKDEIEANLKMITYRRIMGELIEVAPLRGIFQTAIIRTRKELMNVATEFAKRYALPREDRLVLQDLIETKLNRLPEIIEKIIEKEHGNANAA